MQGQNRYVQILQLADDTTLFVKDEAAVLKVLKSRALWKSIGSKTKSRKNRRLMAWGRKKTEKMSLGVLNGIKTI